jgi:hypothetical protein
MSRSFGLVDEKLAEADFFLEKIAAKEVQFFEVRCYFSAFVAASRSVTFALQAVLKGTSGFGEWYAEKQQVLKGNSLAKFFHDARTESQHIGINPVNSGSSATDSAGERVVRYYFSHGLSDTARVVPETDVVTACHDYLTFIVKLIWECYQTFGSVIDSAQYYTPESMAKLGLSLEDVEESLGFPRGWTADIPDEHRIRLLRQQVPEPNIDWIFEKYLKVNRFGIKCD